MFYQKQPKMDVYFRRTKTGHNKIMAHLHSFYELHCCTEGQLHLTIGGKPCILEAGQAALIFPYQAHSFSVSGGEGWFFTFAPELIGTFSKQFANVLPVENIFPFTWDFSLVEERGDLYSIKSFLYAMCSAAARMEYTAVPAEGGGLLEKIFSAAEENFKDSTFSLGTLAAMLGYDYGYISKYFYRKTGIRFSNYLIQRRISCAAGLLDRGATDNLGQLALNCGFGCIRSFNRNFKEIEGISPREYLRRNGR